jgi:MarR family transcriptional regulator, negative regulator of the multidrug operon emrRAB
MHDARLANLLAAAALAVTDLGMAALRGVRPVSPSAAAALVAVATAPGLSVTEIGRRVGLTQSAAARMVQGLETDHLLRRDPGSGREVSVTLTGAGSEAAARLLDARTASMHRLLARLTGPEQAELTELLGTLLAGLYEEIGSSDLLCRLCDRGACTRDAVCPVGQAERDGRA